MKILFIFIDGFGIGEPDDRKNPIHSADTPAFDKLFSEGTVFVTDACLGVAGLPQSATGQTAIFTGINAPLAVGRHVNAQPTKELRDLINEDNLFKILRRHGLRVTNANTYRQEYLDRMLDPKDKRAKPSVTSVMTMSAGIPFRKVEEFIGGMGIYHDITGQFIVDLGVDTSVITPAEAAARFYAVSREYDLTLFEHFVTDLVGHKMDMSLAITTIERLDAFLGALMGLMDPEEDLLLITSDHGNIEDVSVKTHTRNSVPTILYGRIPENIDIQISSLVDITPSVLKLLVSGQRA